MGRRIENRIRRAVRQGRWEATEHALEEAEADGFDAGDVRQVLLTGHVRMVYTHDLRGARYLLCGPVADGRGLCLVCRFTLTRDLRVITVYAQD